jgi:CHAD domain-containing protein
MLSPSEVGWELALYAQEWLQERFRLTLELAGDVSREPTAGAVHDLRVACRRLREAISFFHGVAEVPALSDVDVAARRMARAVRRLREIDVAMKRLARLELGGSADREVARREISSTLKKKRQKMARKKRRRIEKRAKRLETAIKEHLPLRVRPPAVDIEPAKEAELRAFVEARVASRRAEVERLIDIVRARGTTLPSDRYSTRLHGIRVAVKHWRYASEIARAVMPRVLYRPMAARLRHLQDLGGKSQDFADLANVVEREVGAHPSRARKSVVSVVRASRTQAEREFYEALKTLVPSRMPRRQPR